jgi:hypothetical protein
MAASISGLDRESQYQEGLLALWQAARDYKALNFARFYKFARVALQHKFSNLLRYSLATKRRANRCLIPIGTASNRSDSFSAQKLDELVCEHWLQQQAVYDVIERHLDRTQLVLLDCDDEAYDVIEQIAAHNQGRVISSAELNTDLLNMSPGFRRESLEHGIPFEEYDQHARMRDGKFSWSDNKRTEVNETNFPHLNEGEIILSYSE